MQSCNFSTYVLVSIYMQWKDPQYIPDCKYNLGYDSELYRWHSPHKYQDMDLCSAIVDMLCWKGSRNSPHIQAGKLRKDLQSILGYTDKLLLCSSGYKQHLIHKVTASRDW